MISVSPPERSSVAVLGRPISVVIADPHPVFRFGMRRLFEAESDIQVVGESGDGDQAVTMVCEHRSDLLLCEYSMPKLDGAQVIEELKSFDVCTRVVFVTDSIPRNNLLEALRRGLRGWIRKDVATSVFPKAVRCVHKGEVWVERDVLTEWASSRTTTEENYNLSVRELAIIREILSGKSNKEIAAKLDLAEDTVKRHLTNVFRKLNVTSRLELSLFAMHRHLVS